MGGAYKNLICTRRLVLWGAGVLALAAAGSGWWFWSVINPAGLKGEIEAYLSEEFEGEVTIDTLEGRLFPRVGVSGGGMVVRVKGRTDVPPLVTIERFEIRGSFRQFMQRPRHVSEVRLQRLRVQIPPGDDGDAPDIKQTDAEEIAAARKYEAVIVDRFEAPDTVLTIIPREAGKPPKVFTIHQLVMDSVGSTQTIPYLATLTNPISKGEIEASGTFGPWNVAHPEGTRVTGKYLLANADLGTINGLSGILKSEGDFKGPLNRIEVQGTTETPDFRLDAGGKAVPLYARFTAVVDGSHGDTYLNQVDAKFLETELTAKGLVIGLEGVRGRQVEVDVTISKGRIEDLLKVAIDSDTPLVGPAQLQARLVIPAERGRKVIDELKLRGSFGLTRARFTDKSVQRRLVGLSLHGQGKASGQPVADVLSDLKGRLVVDNAVVTFSQLRFGVPGALVALTGRYGLRSEALDFKGELRREAGTVLPIKITGTRKVPRFGLNLF